MPRQTAPRGTLGAVAVTSLFAGLLLLALSWVRASSQLPVPFDAAGCGSLRSPDITIAVATEDTLQDVVRGPSFLSDIHRECEAAYAGRGLEVQVESALGGLLLGLGAALAYRDRRGSQVVR
jgi:hypothetical protein